MAGGRARVLRVGELIDDAKAYMMDLRENTSCETDLERVMRTTGGGVGRD